MKKFITLKEWKTNYPNPIVLEPNDIVEIIKKDNNNLNWTRWIFCKKGNKFGWVPEQIIKSIDSNKGMAIKQYSAKELDITHGEKVLGIKELNGWIWVKRKSNNDEGWLPLEILEEIK